ncbi:MAG: cytochrome c-type biogenesis protein [Rubrivivax sp.]|nr:cytochrome c-type biogenesis protein CcmH [Pseudomonadota bacterium]
MVDRLLAALLLALACTTVPAQQARPLADDPALEARVLHIAEELRCLVCQNESIAASQADLAVDLRQQIRGQLQQGRSDAQIVDYMVQRYGDFVLYRPPVRASTWLLWGGPFVLLAAGAAALVLAIRRQRRGARTPAPLSQAESERLERLLQDGPAP